MTRRRRGGIKREESKLASNPFTICSPQSGSFRDTHRIAQRREEGVKRQRWPEGIKEGIKKRETDPAGNQFSKCSQQSGTHEEIHRIAYRRVGAGRR